MLRGDCFNAKEWTLMWEVGKLVNIELKRVERRLKCGVEGEKKLHSN